MLRGIAQVVFLLAIVATEYRATHGAPPSNLTQLIQALKNAPSGCLETELRDGTLSTFEAVQRFAVDSIDLNRVDLLPIPQRALAEQLQAPLRQAGSPITGVTVGSVWKALMPLKVASWAIYDADPPSRPHAFYDLIFAPTKPISVRSRQSTFSLPADALSYFSVNDRSILGSGSAQRVAIIVHDPHASRAGQFDMIRGLWRILTSYPQQKFVFLVEGQYETDDRSIPLNPWKEILTKGRNSHGIISWMVHNYVIDSAMAVRLLRSQDDIPSFAIDDNALIERTPSRPDSLSRDIDQLATDKRVKDLLKGIVLLAAGRPKAEQRKEIDEVLATVGALSSDAAKVVQKVRDEIEVFELAGKRDRTMSREILRRIAEFPDAIPIVFIGNYHTRGIVDEVAARGTPHEAAVLVLDVRGTFDDHGDVKAFQDSIKNRTAYFAGLPLLKIAVAPRLADRPHVQQLAERRDQELESFRSQIASASSFDQPTTAKLVEQLSTVPIFPRAKITFDGGSPPKPPFRTAFASFSPENGGMLHIYGKEKERWNDGKRARAIAVALRNPPEFDPRRTCRRITTEGRSFFAICDRDSKHMYFFEEANAEPTIEAIEPPQLDENNATLRLRQLTRRPSSYHFQLSA